MPTTTNNLNINSTGILVSSGSGSFSSTSCNQYSTLVGGSSNAIANISPSSTSGYALSSNGASSNPGFAALGLVGGGTAGTSFSNTDGVCVYNGTRIQNYSSPKVDSSGIFTSTTQPYFFAYLNSTQSNFTGDSTISGITFASTLKNVGNIFNTGSFSLNVGVTGTYFLTYCVTLTGITSSHTKLLSLFSTTGAALWYTGENNIYKISDAGGVYLTYGSAIISFSSGNSAVVGVSVSGGSKVVSALGLSSGVYNSYYAGYLLA